MAVRHLVIRLVAMRGARYRAGPLAPAVVCPAMRRGRGACVAAVVAVAWLLVSAALAGGAGGETRHVVAHPAACAHWGRPALAADPRPGAVRVFAIQLHQQPARMATPADFAREIDCAMRLEVAPRLARGRPNLVVFDEDTGLQTLAIGPRGQAARRLLRHGVPSCGSQSLCPTIHSVGALDTGYARALTYLDARFPSLKAQLGQAFVAATDTFVRVFMTTMAGAARRYGVYLIAANTQAPFRVDRSPAAVAALSDPGGPHVRSVYAPAAARVYNETFVWGPRVVHRGAPAPQANLLATVRKVPLTTFELTLGFANGPARGPAAVRNLRPVAIPGSKLRLGIATSLPAFEYGPVSRAHACDDVALTYMRCLDRLGANVLIQADANDGAWTGTDGAEQWQPLSWMGSAWRAVADPSVHFAYAVNPFMVGNLSDIPFDGQTAILERGRRGAGCHYIGTAGYVPGEDQPQYRGYAGAKPQFLALAPWVRPDGPRAQLRAAGERLGYGGALADRYVQTAVIADLPFPVDRVRPGCRVAGR